MTSPDLDTVTLAGGRLKADLTDAITEVTIDYSTGSVAQLVIAAADVAAITGSALMRPGTTLTWQDDPWQVGGRTTIRGSDNTVLHRFTARSTLARGLRKTYKASAETKVSPSQWVARRVLQAGGRATCQPSSRQSTIAQTSGRDRQSTLDVIANLASDLEWSWTEWGGRLLFGSRYWAWQTGPTGRSWAVTWGKDEATDALSSEVTVDDDDTENYVTIALELPYRYGKRIRPWDRIQLNGFGVEATVLVEQVSITADGTTPVRVEASQPRPPAKKAGSSS